jgi:hypothetical protein
MQQAEFNISSDYTSEIDDSEKPSLDKITLLFDLDETFVTSIENDLWSSTHMTTGPHKLITISYKMKFRKNTNDYTEIIAVRPGFLKFKQFLLANLSHFNIGFWSTGAHGRVKAVVDELFPELVRNKQVAVMIGREDKEFPVNGYIKARDAADNYGEQHGDTYFNRVFYDILANKQINFPGHLHGNIVKDVAVLCDMPAYRDILHPRRTILIDDLPANILVNDSHNTIWVSEWGFNFTCDDTLTKLAKWLDKHKHRKSFAKVKMPNYARQSPFNHIYTRNGVEYAIESQKVCDAIYKNADAKTKRNTHLSKTKKRLAMDKQITHKLKKRVTDSKTKKLKKRLTDSKTKKLKKRITDSKTKKLKKRITNSKTKKRK